MHADGYESFAAPIVEQADAFKITSELFERCVWAALRKLLIAILHSFYFLFYD
jgi:hypothetical protein